MTEEYVLTHTPKQIAEEYGYAQCTGLFKQYYERFNSDLGLPGTYYIPFNGKISFPVDPFDYAEELPPDSFFDKVAGDLNSQNEDKLTPRDVKLAFIAVSATKYAKIIDFRE